MSNLALVKSEEFHGVQCDFWQNTDNNSYFMTIDQLAKAIGYSDASGVRQLMSRNEYLHDSEFSTRDELSQVEGKRSVSRERIIFTEDGIYEVSMLASSDRAREFRAKVRHILKELRQGTMKVIKPIDPILLEAKAKNAEARLMNARRKDAEFILKTVNQKSGVLSVQAVELFTISALEIITGKTAPRPQIDKHYTAGEIAKEIGVSANSIGRKATQLNLKTAEYGITVLDKSPHSSKQVESFRYNEKGRQMFKDAFAEQPEKE